MAEVASRGNRAEEVRERRRKPGSTVDLGIKLHVAEEDKDPDYVYRWVNDTGMRVQQMTANDWDPAPYKDARAESRVVGADAGKPIKSVLMRKRKDWHEDDTKAKRKPLDEMEQAIKRGAAHKQEADLSEDVSYTPGSGNSITRG